MTQDFLPTPPEIMVDPELAVLCVLDFTLEATVRALAASYPELGDEEFPRRATETALLADHLVALAANLQRALQRFRWALRQARSKDDEKAPF